MRLVKSILLSVPILVILAFSACAIGGALNLPSAIVRIEVNDGTQSYFDTVLSEVPPGYDVMNATYRGWCVDVRTEMTCGPATHEVFLYSSSSAPRELAGEAWDLINYVLNHKQGNLTEIQQAIWYFTYVDGDGVYVPSSTVAWTIINDTLENDNGFTPAPGQVTAVICYLVILFPNQPDVQISIIEVASDPVIPEFPSTMLAPIMLTMSLAILTYTKKREVLPQSKCCQPVKLKMTRDQTLLSLILQTYDV